MLGGGGARGAYQAGVLRAIARRHPELRLPLLTGISAGAINTAFLASRLEDLDVATGHLAELWLSLSPEKVYRVDAPSLLKNVTRWGWRLISGDFDPTERTQGMVDTEPLRRFLSATLGDMSAVARNVAAGRLHAAAVSATSYTTGQSVTWVDGADVMPWRRTQRRAELSRLDVDRVMASASLPLLFPSVRVGSEWYGDGGIRMTAPLSPALHLGATHILTISTRRPRFDPERRHTDVPAYPPPAQILGVLYNAIFLDVIDEDIRRMEMVNRLLADAPGLAVDGLRPVRLLVLRPSRDLGQLARDYEARLPRGFRFLTRGLGTRRSSSADVLSLLMFQSDYTNALIGIGEDDATEQMSTIDEFLTDAGAIGSRGVRRRTHAATPS
jgi:NTE family protein